MKIALCSSPIYHEYSQVDEIKFPPLWAMALSVHIKSQIEGIDIKYFDGTHGSIDDLLKSLVNYEPDLVCLSPVLISYKNDLALSKELKQNINCKVILGGHHATNLAEVIINNNYKLIDAIITHDGEQGIIDYIKNGFHLTNVHNAVYRADNCTISNNTKQMNLDDTLIPWFQEVYNYSKYEQAYIFSQKGCPIRKINERCIFCARADQGLRYKKPLKVIQEIFFYKNRLDNIKYIFDVCDDFKLQKMANTIL